MRKNKDTMTKVQGHDEDYVDVSISRIIACRILNTSTFFFYVLFRFFKLRFLLPNKRRKKQKRKVFSEFLKISQRKGD